MTAIGTSTLTATTAAVPPEDTATGFFAGGDANFSEELSFVFLAAAVCVLALLLVAGSAFRFFSIISEESMPVREETE